MSTAAVTVPPLSERKPIYNSLFVQVVAGLVLGIILGMAAPDFAISLKILGDGFLKLIKMVIGPIVFCVVVSGMASAGNLKKVGRVGFKSVIYFEFMTTIALVIGALLAFRTRPGVGMNIDLHTLDAGSLATYTEHAKSLKDTARHSAQHHSDPVVDASPATTSSRSCSSPCCLASRSRCSAKAQRVTALIEALSTVLFKIMGFIVGRAARRARRCCVHDRYVRRGVAQAAGLLVFVFYASGLLFVLVVLGGVLRVMPV